MPILFPDAPKRVTAWSASDTLISGSVIVIGVNTSQIHNYYSIQSPAANGDERSEGIWLRDGTYVASVLGIRGPNYGRVDWYLDGVVVASLQDWYSAGTTYNVVQTFNVVISNGLLYHTLKVKVNGKNASSTDYFFLYTSIWFRQATD